jgi:hypothetical protein
MMTATIRMTYASSMLGSIRRVRVGNEAKYPGAGRIPVVLTTAQEYGRSAARMPQQGVCTACETFCIFSVDAARRRGSMAPVTEQKKRAALAAEIFRRHTVDKA